MSRNRRVVPLLTIPSLLLLIAAGGCSSAGNLLFKPKPDDPNDGYNSLEDAGPSTTMDWGPGQELLLKDHTLLQQRAAQLQKQVEQLEAENKTLTSQLSKETTVREQQERQRQQSEAYVLSLQRKIRDLEGKVLSLSIEKTKLEQTVLVSEIAKLQRSLEDLPPTVEASAPGGK